MNKSNAEIYFYAGKLRMMQRKNSLSESMRFFYEAYTLDSKQYDALVEWLKLKVENHEKTFAVKFLKNLILSDSGNANLYWAMGEVYAVNKEYRKAIENYHKSLDIDSRISKVRMSLGAALEAVGEFEKAVAEYRLAALLDKRNTEGFYKAADILYQMKSYAQAEEVLRYLIGVTPTYPGAHRYLSKISQIKNQKDAALESMKREVTNNPENYKYVLELAELYIEYDKFDQAIQELTKVSSLPSLKTHPEYRNEKIRAYLLLSRCFRTQNKLESAEGAIKLALEIDPSDPELHRELGFVYYSEQRDKEGAKAFEFYLERNPAARDAATIKGLIQRMMIEE
jgi:predicted Zn-dependent protease